KKWIERLDAGSGEGVRFYVYNLQNQRAEHIGPLLQQALTGQVTQPQAAPPPTVAPGTPAGSIISPPTFQPQSAFSSSTTTQSTTTTSSPTTGAGGGVAASGAARRAITGAEGGEGVV